jgi:hypothetical protein
MFGQPEDTNTQTDMGAPALPMTDPSLVPAMDQSYAMPTDQSAPATDHHMTPAYPSDTTQQTGGQMPDYAGLSTPAPSYDEPVADAGMTGLGTDMPHSPSVQSSSTQGDDDLMAIKQDALGALAPLVGQLEQSAEEKFKTTMMMIQASDDRSLVRAAYEAAQGITDEKVRAQALLDVVNEINYFTSHQS